MVVGSFELGYDVFNNVIVDIFEIDFGGRFEVGNLGVVVGGWRRGWCLFNGN